MAALGVFMPGAYVEADIQRSYNADAFALALGPSSPHADQIRRQDLDKRLYEHVRESGADAREGHEVLQVDQRGPRKTLVDLRTDTGAA